MKNVTLVSDIEVQIRVKYFNHAVQVKISWPWKTSWKFHNSTKAIGWIEVRIWSSGHIATAPAVWTKEECQACLIQMNNQGHHHGSLHNDYTTMAKHTSPLWNHQQMAVNFTSRKLMVFILTIIKTSIE